MLGRFRRNSLVHSVGILVGGTVGAQAILALSMPILTRLYSPEDFNLLAVYASLLGLITVVSCLRFNVAIPLPEEPSKGLNLVVLSLASAAVFACLTLVPVIVAPQAVADLLGQPAIQPYLWMVPAGVMLSSSYDALQYWASRKRQFALITRTRMVRAIGGAGSQLAIGSIAPSSFGLMLGHMVYNGLGVVDLARALWRDDRSSLKSVTCTSLIDAARSYRRFPIFSVPEALFNAIGVEVSVLVIATAAVGPEAGFLALAMRVMGLPMSLVGSSVAQVFLVEAPERLRSGDLPAFTRRMILALFKTGATPLIAVGIASPWLFPIVFGAEWARAGTIVAWLTPMFILQFAASPVSMVLHVTGKIAHAMWLQIIGGIIRVGCVVIAARIMPSHLVEVFAVTGAMFYLAYLMVIHMLVGSKIQKIQI